MPTRIYYATSDTAAPGSLRVVARADTGWNAAPPLLVDTAPKPKPREVKTLWQHLKKPD